MILERTVAIYWVGNKNELIYATVTSSEALMIGDTKSFSLKKLVQFVE